MAPGLVAGSAAAIVAVFLSLPLRSPSDTLFNSVSVALAALLAGVLAEVIWRVVRGAEGWPVRFLVAWSVIYLPLAVAIITYGRSQLDHFVGFAAPLAFTVYVVTGVLTIGLPRYLPNMRWWCPVVAVGIAIALGFGLVNQADQESGRLELPPPGSRLAPAETAPPHGNVLVYEDYIQR